MKRSAQVALVVMSAATVGGVGYAMMPRENCTAPAGAAADGAKPSCRFGGSSGTYHGRSIFGGGSGDNSGSSSSTAAPSRASAGTERGGFGGFFAGLSRGT
jgi:hypothetical protein